MSATKLCVRRWALATLALAILTSSVTAEEKDGKASNEDGFVSIFDGKTLKNWDGNPDFWTVKDGAITGETTKDNPTKGNTFIIWRGGDVSNFELKLQYKIIGTVEKKRANSGIQYRSFEVKDQKWVVGGYQADFEAGDTYSGILYGERFRGILAGRGEKTEIMRTPDQKKIFIKKVGKVGDSKKIQSKIKAEDWNDYHIIAKDFHFVHKINGVTTCEATDLERQRRESGIIALQLHAGPPMRVQFRNIRLKKTGNAKKAASTVKKK